MQWNVANELRLPISSTNSQFAYANTESNSNNGFANATIINSRYLLCVFDGMVYLCA